MIKMRSYISDEGLLVYLPETSEEIATGMGVFGPIYRRHGRVPKVGMLFPLQGKFSRFTMTGVDFPLNVIYYDINWNILDYFVAQPTDRDSYIPPNVWWMYETTL
jgi:uncharacterized membrane protein (UPF0127 family)